jgi:hypothetical protein
MMTVRHQADAAAETLAHAASAAMSALRSVIRYYELRPSEVSGLFGANRLRACVEAERELRRAFADLTIVEGRDA